MKLQGQILLLTSVLPAILAQQSPWGQCGGNGWDGPTTCTSGYHCIVQNDWYWQCIPGEATTEASSTTVSSSTTSASPSSETSSSTAPSPSAEVCDGSFTSISAEDYVEAMNPGWNLGNSLDAVPNEGSWNNDLVQEGVFDYIVEQGFRSVRVPVTYAHHFTSESPDWTIDPDWLDRVEEVIDFALERDLYVITNVHHDSWEWADVTLSGADVDEIQERFRAAWYQIGVKLGCKSSLLSFESINEPPANTAQQGALINEFNEIFLDAITEAGGFNSERVVQLTGAVSDPLKTTQWFEPPQDIENPWALQFHYYAPYDFIFSAWGKTTWGSAEDYALLADEIAMVRGNFTDVPLVLGEYDASQLNTEPAARWKYFDHLAQSASDAGAALVIWDNGLDHLDRNTGVWRDPVSLAIIDAVLAGETNSLPASTTDGGAEEQWSSAFIWNKVGDEVDEEGYELPWLFNGNELVGVETQSGDVLAEGADGDYFAVSNSDSDLSSDAIVFTQSFLDAFLGPDEEPGSKANLTLTFSEGAFSIVEVIQWDTPELLVDDAPSPTLGQDYNIPTEYKGWSMVAAVRVQGVDGTILFDDWTQWLGPLQQGRATFNNQWFFDGEQVVIRAEALQAVANFGSPVEFEFEFYPRVEGNSVTITLDPVGDAGTTSDKYLVPPDA